jgi:cytochrome bd-type quinol oxidase subunit 2
MRTLAAILNKMTANILKRLTYSFLISLSVGLLFGLIVTDRTDGNEAKQGAAIAQILTVIICLTNFILSMTALLNLKKDVRENHVSSTFSFVFLPAMVLLGLIFMVFKDENSRVEFWDTSLIIGPTIVYVSALAFHSIKFRQELKENGD